MSQLVLDGAGPAGMERWARLSPCGTYRYLLGRRWDTGPALRWVMLNPSTADGEVDDPTIRRVIRFSHAAGYRCAVIANLFALRATDPRALRHHRDPVGPDNDQLLQRLAHSSLITALRHDHQPVVAVAWGARAPTDRVHAALDLLAPAPLVCLGTTIHGQPRHPLYVPADRQLAPFTATEERDGSNA